MKIKNSLIIAVVTIAMILNYTSSNIMQCPPGYLETELTQYKAFDLKIFNNNIVLDPNEEFVGLSSVSKITYSEYLQIIFNLEITPSLGTNGSLKDTFNSVTISLGNQKDNTLSNSAIFNLSFKNSKNLISIQDCLAGDCKPDTTTSTAFKNLPFSANKPLKVTLVLTYYNKVLYGSVNDQTNIINRNIDLSIFKETGIRMNFISFINGSSKKLKLVTSFQCEKYQYNKINLDITKSSCSPTQYTVGDNYNKRVNIKLTCSLIDLSGNSIKVEELSKLLFEKVFEFDFRVNGVTQDLITHELMLGKTVINNKNFVELTVMINYQSVQAISIRYDYQRTKIVPVIEVNTAVNLRATPIA